MTNSNSEPITTFAINGADPINNIGGIFTAKQAWSAAGVTLAAADTYTSAALTDGTITVHVSNASESYDALVNIVITDEGATLTYTYLSNGGDVDIDNYVNLYTDPSTGENYLSIKGASTFKITSDNYIYFYKKDPSSSWTVIVGDECAFPSEAAASAAIAACEKAAETATTSIANVDTAVSSANTAANTARTAAAGAANVNAVLNGSVLTVTDRDGKSTSVTTSEGVKDVVVNGKSIVANGIANITTTTETVKLQILVSQDLSKAIDASTGEVIDVDGKTEDYAQQNYVSDFITLKKGQTFYGENTLCRGSECLLAVYSISDSSFISGINRDNKSTPKSYSYTATEDVYLRVSNCTNNNLGGKAKFYIEYIVETNNTDVYDTYTADTTTAYGALGIYDTTLLFSKRYQDFVSLVNVEGIDVMKITSKAENGAYVALLKSYSTESAQGDNPDYVNKVLYHIEKDRTITIDVTDAVYVLFVGSRDRLPNTLPAEIQFIRTSEKDILMDTEQALQYEPDYTDVKLEVEAYTESDKIDIEGAERITYKLYGVSSRPSRILDKNENDIMIFGYGDAEGDAEGEVTVPRGTKYLVYRTKSNKTQYYIHVYYKKQMTAGYVKNELASIRELTQNAGYHYLADGYNILTTNDDNSEALQALVDTVNKNGGGIIELGLGTYNFKNTVTMKSNVGIMGQGIGHTILNMVDSDTATAKWPMFNGDFVQNIFIKDLEIHSESTTNTGKHLFMRYIEDSHFTRIKSVGSRPTAIGIDFLNHVTITDNIIINGGRMGDVFGCACIGIGTGYDEWENEDFVISNNICINGGQRGIFVEDQARFGGKAKMKAGYGQVITGNIVRGGYRGITVEAGKRVNVSGNTIYGATIGMGVKVYADDCLFQGNLLVGNKTGVIVDDLSSTFVENNNLAFIGNTIKGSDTGFSVKTDGMVTGLYIKDNVIQDNVNGIVIEGGCKNLVVQGNNDYSTTKSFSFDGTFTDAVIKDNTYFIDPEKGSSAAFSGSTKWVEQVTV